MPEFYQKFYRHYPLHDRNAVSNSTAQRKGSSENLCQYMAFGFKIGSHKVEKKMTATEGDTMFESKS